MAKKSQRQTLRYEKDRAGCMRGLISMFDFRHGRSTKKLLADRRRGNKQDGGERGYHAKLMQVDSDGKHQETGDCEESRMASTDNVKTSVKKLMEEDMFNKQVPNKQMNDSEAGLKIDNSEYGCNIRKDHEQRNKTWKKSNGTHNYDSDTAKDLGPGKPCDKVCSKKTSDNTDLEIMMQELCQIHPKSCSCVKHLLHGNSDMQSDRACTVDKEKLSAAFKVFIEQSLPKSKNSEEDDQFQHSREIVDALRKLSSNKNLFLKLLQDPNSPLVKGLEEIQLEKDYNSNSLPGSGFLGQKLNHSKTDELINHKQHKFFRRRSKSRESFPLMGNEKCQSSSKIVILKPGPTALRQTDNEITLGTSMQSQYLLGNKIQCERSQFSFTEMKRKLKHAIRKEKPGISPNEITHKSRPEHHKLRDFDKGVGGENVGWCSPNRNHFYTERFAKPSASFKRGETISKPFHAEATKVPESSSYLKPGVCNIYLEAKKHLLEMLSSDDDDTELMSGQVPKSLGRILSLSEYDYSLSCSPWKDSEESIAAAPVKLSPCGTFQSVNGSSDKLVEDNVDSQPSQSEQIPESPSCFPLDNTDEKVESRKASGSVPCDLNQSNLVEEALSSTCDVIIFEGAVEIEETTQPVYQGDNAILVASCELSCSTSVKDGKTGDVAEECDEDGLTESPKMVSFGERQLLSSPSASPSHSSVSMKVENFEGTIDRKERPSPVSVLDPLFSEDDISPARTISRPAELEIQPRQIQFQEQRSSVDLGIRIGTSLEGEESTFEYVEAVLLGSGLNWDEYLLRWLSSCPVLDSMLYDEVVLFSNQSHHKQKLLFDCTNEVLGEVCECYFGSFLGVSCCKQSMRPVPKGMNLIHEIWEGVEWHLLQYPPPQSSDELIKKDMAKSSAWLDLRLDIEHIGTEMEKLILEKLVEDAISSFIYDTSESNFVGFPADSTESRSNIDLESKTNFIQIS